MQIWDFYFSAGSSTSKTRLSPVSGGERSMSQFPKTVTALYRSRSADLPNELLQPGTDNLTAQLTLTTDNRNFIYYSPLIIFLRIPYKKTSKLSQTTHRNGDLPTIHFALGFALYVYKLCLW